MATEIIMPKAGMAMEEGKIIRWLKEVGDTVESGEGVMEIETDKITMENEAPASGVLLAKLYGDGETVPVTTVIGYIGKQGEAAPQTGGGHVPATPYAKKIAAENGLDIAAVQGSGAGGVIKARDVEKAVKATPLAARIAAGMGVALDNITGTGFAGKITSADLPKPEAIAKTAATETLGGMRGVIARRMTRSHLEIPPVTMNMKAYVDELLALRAKINKNRETKLTLGDFIVKACAKAVAMHKEIRTEIDMEAGTLTVRADVNIAVAVSVPGGLVVPVIKNADKLSVSEISARVRDFAARAKSGTLNPDEYSGSVFTISNMGAMDVHDFTPVINQPNAAIMGVGGLNDELALIDGEVAVKKYLMLCLTYDHRIMDGVEAAVFQQSVKKLLEDPMDILV